MPLDILQTWLAREAVHVNETLRAALEDIPGPCRPAAAHILESGGKRLRPFLTILCARALGYEKEDIYKLAASMEMLHAATLLHDDVLDNAASRRGRPAAHVIFGANHAILSGDALLASGNALVAAFGQPELSLCYSLATSHTAAGEILELDSLHNPLLSLDEYLRIAKGKTACLISQSCRIGALAARSRGQLADACAIFGENLGVAFQLVDDALDFAPEAQTGKPSGGDLREGKMTPPLMLYRQSLTATARENFDANFRAATFSDAQLASIAASVAPYALETRRLAGDYIAGAREALAALPERPEKEILLKMADYVGARNK